MSASQRRKGHAFEREVAQTARLYFPNLDIKRGLGQARGGGAETGGDVVGIPGLHVECKVGAHPNPAAAWRQAQRDVRGPFHVPVAVTRETRGTVLVTLAWEDFLRILERAERPAAATEKPSEEMPF